MFTQPINQTGLAGFIPLRRQEGGVPNEELNIGQIAERDIFGREIGKTNIPQTTTDIGQLPSTSPDEFAPGLSSLNINQTSVGPSPETSSFSNGSSAQSFNFNDPAGAPMFVGQTNPNTSQNMSDTLNTMTTGKDQSGIQGVFNTIGDEFTSQFQTAPEGYVPPIVASTITSGIKFATKGLSSLAPLVNLATSKLQAELEGKEYGIEDASWDLAQSSLIMLFPPAAIPIMIFKLGKMIYDAFSGGADSTNVTGNFGLNDANRGLEDAFDDPNTGSPSQSAIFGPSTDTTNEDNQSLADNTGELDIGVPEIGFSGGDIGGDIGGFGDGDPSCWVAGTKILMADNTYCNIEDLTIGSMVMSYPETKKTRRWNTPLEAKPIVSLLVDVHPEIWHLNDSMVSGTEWMIKGDGTAAIVQWLNIGDTVLGADNNLVEVTRVEPAEGNLKKQVIYNFETKDNYTYIADGMRTIRGRAVRAPERGPWSEEYLSGDTNAYEGSMQDEYDKKFKTYTS